MLLDSVLSMCHKSIKIILAIEAIIKFNAIVQ
jgi:hypothetical protein